MRSTLVSFLFLLATTALPLSAGADGGGTITGKVDSTPAKYLENTVVYLK